MAQAKKAAPAKKAAAKAPAKKAAAPAKKTVTAKAVKKSSQHLDALSFFVRSYAGF